MSESLSLDPVTAAAVKIKSTVRTQWEDSKSKAEKPGFQLGDLPKQLLDLVKTVFQGELDEIAEDMADFMDDFESEIEGISSELCSVDIDDLKDQAQAMYRESIAGVMDPKLIKQAEKHFVDSMHAAKQRAGAAVEVKVDALMNKVEQTKAVVTSKLWQIGGFTLFGFVVGIVISVYIMLRVPGFDLPNYGITYGSALFDRFPCIYDGDTSCLPDASNSTSNPWPHVRFRYGGAFALSSQNEMQNLKGGLSGLTVVCLILRLVTVGTSMSLIFVSVAETKKGLESAAMPMSVCGAILNGWVLEESVTTTQLNAWWDARRSLLNNEVAMLIGKFENVVFGYLARCCSYL